MNVRRVVAMPIEIYTVFVVPVKRKPEISLGELRNRQSIAKEKKKKKKRKPGKSEFRDQKMKFWAAAGESSSESSSSGSESEREEQPKKTVPAAAGRYAGLDVSSSDESEGGRVVRAAKDKRWDEIREVIRKMKNGMKIRDYADLLSEYDSLLKAVTKAKNVVEREGYPKFLIKFLVDFEAFIDERHKDREAFKKLSAAKAKAFNTLRSKVRKSNDPFQEDMSKCKENPEDFAEADDASEEESSDESEDEGGKASSESGSSSESGESSDSDSDSDSDGDSDDSDEKKKKKKKPKKVVDDDSDDESSDSAFDSDSDSDTSSSSDEEPVTEFMDKHARALAKWGVKRHGNDTKKEKEKKEKRERQDLATKAEKAAKAKALKEKKAQDKPLTQQEQDQDVANAEEVSKRVAEIIAQRGRKGTDRNEMIKQLQSLYKASQAIGPQSQLEVLSHLISALFDTTAGVFQCLNSDLWTRNLNNIQRVVELIRAHSHCSISTNYSAFGVGTEEEVGEGELDEAEREGLRKAREQNEKLSTFNTIVFFLERLDDELTKALQFTDSHSPEFSERLRQSGDFLALLWMSKDFLYEKGHPAEAARAASRIIEQVYYKRDYIARQTWLMAQSGAKRLGMDAADVAAIPADVDTAKTLEGLCDLVFQHGEKPQQLRALLSLSFHYSLQGDFFRARDLLLMTSAQRLADSGDEQTKILFNRNLVQLAICAFRKGRIADAHNCLVEVCAQGKAKELLAQGVASSRHIEKTIEQERAEKRRQLPYNMHIPLELVESVHYVSAMLLEIPNIAASPYDNRKRVISRHFRKMLDQYERQTFTGRPENPREAVLFAARALQKADWKGCFDALKSMKFWDLLPESEQAREVILDQVKREALRTFLFTYAPVYDSLSLEQLSKTFGLSKESAYALVSKLIVNGDLCAAWDETSACLIVHRVEPSRLQHLCLGLADKSMVTVENFDRVLQAGRGGDRRGGFGDRRGGFEKNVWRDNIRDEGDRQRGALGIGMLQGRAPRLMSRPKPMAPGGRPRAGGPPTRGPQGGPGGAARAGGPAPAGGGAWGGGAARPPMQSAWAR
uniref:Eukaryotic translation initiation factor 3 subunit C n=1 Tax=Chromera velia CCMP2878 TaxID=1169474 RepID=A0A0G4GX82_9ALVE|eukprot:Cvel_23775.t1-p1 / transcript=Cvel_23775.t1 / gene=Cvel_23775 / organism=Chromera_velia_CCMP2878 / gene_product=Eukaryotic translation initiation factor 3 subunit, putative / transcript_product=Eukaryotic translation initiation factor 3 subunit, putative / location=Cvel_scaffold2494:14282-23283(-) / protein_length=1074 / sequence_SO=supercontig / SO=protein_coding / is_pseudo=false